MKRTIIFFIGLTLPLFCMAQSPLTRQYSYDAAGNRTSCAVLQLPPQPPQSPPAPPDSTVSEGLGAATSLLSSDLPISDLKISDLKISDVLISDVLISDLPISEPLIPEYFVENIAQVEIKIYPNPATEKITLAISGWEHLQTGMFKLYTLSGQLLQEQPVHSSTTTISLAGFSKGAYILKVHINGQTEDWKIIKQ